MSKPAPAPSELVAFISSTYVDLQGHRDKTEEALTRIQAGFRSMKFFGSREGEPLEQCLEKLRQCNYYVGIIGHRYGAVHDVRNRSYTELEYEEAKRRGIRRRIYLAGPSVQILPEHIESDQTRRQLEAFKQKLKKENTVVFFSSPEDLATKVISDILLSISEKEGITAFARSKYFPSLRKTCASISFLGLDIRSMKRHRDVDLEKVYVQNRFVRRRGSLETSLSDGALHASGLQKSADGARAKALFLPELFSQSDRAVVLGIPVPERLL